MTLTNTMSAMHPRTCFAALVIVTLCAGLAACATQPPSATPAARTGLDTIAVPEGHNDLGVQLQHSLTQHGWSLTRYNPDVLQQSRTYDQLARRARYRLTLSTTRIGACRDGAPSFFYNLALIENRSGDVALALTGASCIGTAVQKFEDGLNRKNIRPPQKAAALDAQNRNHD